MLQSIRDLIGTRLDVGDREGEFRDAFFRLEDGMIRYIALDLGGWLTTDTVIVSTDLLSPPEGDSGRWSVSLDEAALETAPRWNETDRAEEIDLRLWPPVIVGPFGSTISPILLYEQLQAGKDDRDDDTLDGTSAAPLIRSLQRVGHWLGLPAFDASGEIGRLHDMDFDPQNGRILAFVLNGPGPLPSRGAALPYVMLRHIAEQGTHLVFGETAVPEEVASR
ncbi:PRC-barrel domain-containing protein [Tropicimonas sp. IMCC6043]|uniref:PRC-barrel domain-containing protein n=1 Tax=Tropicimonas sp. IMCC6043 TaxID=2510645 RepID=UPI00101C6A63|nr:PRC-barrel domain-containing protein [Tropicimonas sp. IMCC6043]RYH11328.1 PRC-barrel domain containing protein [Tropicimonas sp. IMCC6043]